MCLRQFLQDIRADQMDEIVYLFTSVGILITKGVEDNTAINVYVLAERVVLKGIASVDDRGINIFLFLFRLLPEKRLVIFEVLKRRLDSHVHFALKNLDHFAMQRHAFCTFAVPYFQHLVIRVLLLMRYLRQHFHLL
jgi:hypothetical protein